MDNIDHSTTYRRRKKRHHSTTSLAMKNKATCPKCESDNWVRIHRSWWQKFFHKHENLCLCHDCRQQFWVQR